MNSSDSSANARSSPGETEPKAHVRPCSLEMWRDIASVTDGETACWPLHIEVMYGEKNPPSACTLECPTSPTSVVLILQFHGFKSLPMLYKTEYIDDLEDPELRVQYPTINLVGKWYDKIKEFHDAGITDNKYGPLKRVMRRYREYVAEDYLPTVTVKDLTWQPLY